MKIFSSLLFLMVLSVLAFSCQKESTPQTTPTKTDLITTSAWMYQDSGIDNNRDGVIDAGGSLSILLPSAVPTCRTDNVITFKTDNTGLVDEGATKCNTTDPSQTTFNWSFADNETTINVSNNVVALFNGKSKIYALTSTSFSLTRDTVLGGTTYPLLVILKH